jgi:hypothetical protein
LTITHGLAGSVVECVDRSKERVGSVPPTGVGAGAATGVNASSTAGGLPDEVGDASHAPPRRASAATTTRTEERMGRRREVTPS